MIIYFKINKFNNNHNLIKIIRYSKIIKYNFKHNKIKIENSKII